MADALRGSMDAAEYKHVCLGLLFLKYISDVFEEKHAALLAETAEGADPEDPDEYRAQSIFWAPPEARWPHLKAQARQSTIGQLVDDAMAGIEREGDGDRAGAGGAAVGGMGDHICEASTLATALDLIGRAYKLNLGAAPSMDPRSTSTSRTRWAGREASWHPEAKRRAVWRASSGSSAGCSPSASPSSSGGRS